MSIPIASYCSTRSDDLLFLSKVAYTTPQQANGFESTARRTKSYLRFRKHGQSSYKGDKQGCCRRSLRRRLNHCESSSLKDSSEDRDVCLQVKRTLESHKWMSKRMIMSGRDNNANVHATWGYRLPLRHCGRGHKSVLRATNEACIFYDSSFLQPLQLKAESSSAIIQLLSAFMVGNLASMK